LKRSQFSIEGKHGCTLNWISNSWSHQFSHKGQKHLLGLMNQFDAHHLEIFSVYYSIC